MGSTRAGRQGRQEGMETAELQRMDGILEGYLWDGGYSVGGAGLGRHGRCYRCRCEFAIRFLPIFFHQEQDAGHNKERQRRRDMLTPTKLGGSGGHDAVALATAHPNLRLVVQDLHECAPIFASTVPSTLTSRVTFHEHSFFDPQPVEASVYLLKFIFHDWPDAECKQILQALRPALKPGAKLLFIEYMGKQREDVDEGLPRSIRQFGTSTDLRMMALFNARERPVGAWERILKSADERFEIARLDANPLTYIVVIEVVWRGE